MYSSAMCGSEDAKKEKKWVNPEQEENLKSHNKINWVFPVRKGQGAPVDQ